MWYREKLLMLEKKGIPNRNEIIGEHEGMDPKHKWAFEKSLDRIERKKQNNPPQNNNNNNNHHHHHHQLDSHPFNRREKQKMNSDADGLCMGGRIK